MGREVRRVTPNWQHPKRMQPNGRVGYVPMLDEPYEPAKKAWDDGLQQWLAGTHTGMKWVTDRTPTRERYIEAEGPSPKPEYYRPDWKPEEATWFQVYETVSEGTPVTPPFATQEELVEYLVANGDFWDQERRQMPATMFPMACEPWERHAAHKFVFGTQWAVTFTMDASGVYRGHEQ